MVEREVLLHRAPLYGRRTGALRVEEMPFRALAEVKLTTHGVRFSFRPLVG